MSNSTPPLPPASRRGAAQGQIMILFALTLVVVVGAMALAVDLTRLRAEAENAQRAANAAALAGVVFMPNYIDTAQRRAIEEATKNGFQNGTNGVSVSPQTVPGYPGQLQVTVSEPVSFIFAPLLGLTNRSISRSAKAEYYQPLQIGGPDHVLGYAPFPTTLVNPAAAEGFYLENKGQFEVKNSGDAYSPLFESFKTSISQPNVWTPPGGADIPVPPPNNNPCAITSNQCAFTANNTHTTGNADNVSNGFNGYDYIIDNPVTNTTVLIKLFDPWDEGAFDASASNFDNSSNPNTAYAPSHSNRYSLLGDSSTQNSPTANTNCILGSSDGTNCRTKLIDESGGNTAFGSHETTLEFSLYGPCVTAASCPANLQVSNTDCTYYPAAQPACVYQAPFRAGADPTLCSKTKGCSYGRAYQFMNYAVIKGPGIYRLQVRSTKNSDNTYGTRGNAYGIAACSVTTAPSSLYNGPDPVLSDPFKNDTSTPGWDRTSCTDPNTASGKCSSPIKPATGDLCLHVYGLGKMAIHNWLSSGTSLIPLGSIPPEYNGKTLQVRLYDVGDVIPVNGKSDTLEVLTPAGDLGHVDGAPNGSSASALPYTYAASPQDGSGVDQGFLTLPPTSVGASTRLDVTGATFNGTWLTVSIPLPAATTYSQMTSNFGSYWKMLYSVNGYANDATTWQINIAGSPVHLLAP